MKTSFLFLVVVVLACIFSPFECLYINPTNHKSQAGGYSQVSISELSDDQKKIDEYIRNQTGLQKQNLTKFQQQIVQGVNYRLTYQTQNKQTNFTIILYVKDRENKKDITYFKASTIHDDNGLHINSTSQLSTNANNQSSIQKSSIFIQIKAHKLQINKKE